MNAPGGRFLTYESYRRSTSHTDEWPSCNSRPASGAEAPSRPEGHVRTTRVGGATRRALHGVEHRSMLYRVMATAITIGHRMHVDDFRTVVNGYATRRKRGRRRWT